MELKFDAELFDKYQAALASEIAQRVMIKLREAGLQGEDLSEFTASITHSITSIIDDMSAIESDGEAIKPYLTFRTGEKELLHCGENSCVNTFVYDALKKLF